MTDELEDELEFQEFMDGLRKLEEQIFWKHRDLDVDKATDAWHDIRVYGDEPIFASIIFDRMLEEAANEPQR